MIPYIKHGLHIRVEYLQLVGVIFGLGLKVYFTNLVAMYRMYALSNRVTGWSRWPTVCCLWPVTSGWGWMRSLRSSTG